MCERFAENVSSKCGSKCTVTHVQDKNKMENYVLKDKLRPYQVTMKDELRCYQVAM